MTNIEIAERTLASLQDQRDRASVRASEIAAERQLCAYAFYAAGSEEAKTKLAALNRQAIEIVQTSEALDGALLEARKRLALARDAVARTDASEHCLRARTLLKALIEDCPALDHLVPHPEDGQLYAAADPPLVCRTAAQVSALLVELHALGLDRGAAFPPHWHGAAGKEDLRKALLKVLMGWGFSLGATRGPLKPGQRQQPIITFAKIFDELNKRLRGSLGEGDRTNSGTEKAA
jgi:hypothetical protein